MMKNYFKLNRLSVMLFILFSIFTIKTAWAQCQTSAIFIDNIDPNAVKTTTAHVTWIPTTTTQGLNYEWQIRTSGVPTDGIDPNGGFVKSGNTPTSVTSVVLNSLKFSTQYHFYVKYNCSASTSTPWQPAVDSKSFTTKGLDTPNATAAILVKTTSFIAKWDPVPGAAFYKLDVNTDSGFGAATMVGIYNNLQVNDIYKEVTSLTSSTPYYFRVRAIGLQETVEVSTINSNTIGTATVGTDPAQVIWTGTWSNGSGPTEFIDAVIDASYNTQLNGRFKCKSLTITLGNTLTIESNSTTGTNYRYVVVNGPIINNAGSGVYGILVKTSGNLIQFDPNGLDIINLGGDITVERSSNALWRLDYTMWSTPVISSLTLAQFSPNTSPSRFYDYNTAANQFSSINPDTEFSPGAGYLIRMPDDWVSNPETTNPKTEPGDAEVSNYSFKGRAFAKNLTVPISQVGSRYNMVGNPYPSSLNVVDFINDNPDIVGTLYFWRRTNDTSNAGGSSAFYATSTSLGGTKTLPIAGGVVSGTPNLRISKGQGFLVQANATGSNLTVKFKNSQRVGAFDKAPTFFRTANKTTEEDTENDGLERNRLWLNVTSEAGAFGQTLVGYMTGASNDLDRADGEYMNDGTFALTSLLDNKEYIIQGRALPFQETDVVPMLFKTPIEGEFSITLDQVDGLFLDGQAVYIKDNLTNTINNLNEKPYTFSSEKGIFSDRFEIVYNTSSLSTNNPSIDANSVVVYKSNQTLNINSGAIAMKTVELYDMSGRVIYKTENIANTKVALSDLNFQNQIVIIKITTEAGIVSKKFSWTK